MSDLISRQAAIERATKEHDFFRGAVTVSDKARRDELLNVMCWLGELPPAQPDIIRCKDCIYQTESWSGIKYCEAHGDHIGKDYDYCSNARRKENG